MACKCMTQYVPAYAPELRTCACPPKGMLAHPFSKHAAVVLAEDPFAPQMPVLFEHPPHALPERHLPRLPTLG